MADTTTEISNEELRSKLMDSGLGLTEKSKLYDLVPEMNEAEKGKLMEMINDSQEIVDLRNEDKRKYQEGLKKLNEEYGEKMQKLTKDSEKKIVEEFEKAEKEEGIEELAELESELDQI